jgi:CRISPR/Cas system-associated exonuclease Cas4 (RecB family)
MRTWSFSSLNTYVTCPRQYYLTYVKKTIPYQETEATKWGTEVHQALENYAKDGAPLAPQYVEYQPYVDKVKSLPGELFTERQFALTRNMEPCGFDSEEAWCRGIIDLGVIAAPKAIVADYKTGRIRHDSLQLMLFAAFVMHHWPDVDFVRTVYLWLKYKQTTVKSYTREDLPEIWGEFMPIVQKLESSYERDKWVPKPSGLCRGWCGAGPECEFWSPRR